MDSIDHYISVASSSSLEKFVASHPHGFLLKRPQHAAGHAEIGFRTEHIAVGRKASEGASDEWGIAHIAKRPTNPFPELITVGRAPNCDVVIRMSFVSKVHVHLLLVGDSMQVRDAGSANGSKLRGASLGAQPVPIHDGDRLSLAGLDLELVSAARAHKLLQALARSGAATGRRR
jgi:hypothetical protein